MRNIILVGFMGTGKTVVGKKVAERLNLRYVSTDDVIEEREQRPISEIFATEDEPYFRTVEKEVVKEVSQMENVVIAAGGGAVLDEENVRNLKAHGVMICLSATPQAILKRTKEDSARPLLKVEDPKKKIKELLRLRAPYYAKADYTIDTSNLTVEEVVGKVVELVK